jgi:hypothetical protein
MTDSEYSIRLEGQGLTVDQQVTKEVALTILNLVMGGSAAHPGPTVAAAAPVPPAHVPPPAPEADASIPVVESHGTSKSVGEFVDEVEAKRNPDKIVAMGVWLKGLGEDRFTSDRIKPLFQAAGEPTPANFARDWRWAVTAKWIAQSHDDPKSFYVTASGEKAVKAHFPAETRKATAQPVKRRSRKKRNGSTD